MAAAIAFTDRPYEIGDNPVLTLSFTRAGSAFDPDTVTVTYRNPHNVAVTKTDADAEITNPSVGTYVINIPLDAPGEWKVYARATHTAAQFAGITFEFSVNGL